MISGIGGLFIYSENPAELAGWYKKAFKLSFEEFENGNTSYTVFWAKHDTNPERRLDTTFAIMKAKKPIAAKVNNDDEKDMYGDRNYMLNLRVEDMPTTLKHLAENGIEILSSVDEGYGLFAWVLDPDGNRIELYQPVRDDY
jgi:predicted enzyme related to lactoylglutathione lyase